MKKIVLSLVMSCALLASSAVMAQDAKPAAKSEKAKTCCTKGADKKEACPTKKEAKCDEKKSAPAKTEKK